MKRLLKSPKLISKAHHYSGFTLIELLIVIVIIGILAGVLIAVINPARQQNRARDANVIATINKVVLSTQGYVAAYGAAPDEVQMFNGLQLATQSGTTCGTTGAFDCLFTVTGNNLPTNCGANNWSGDTTTTPTTSKSTRSKLSNHHQ